MAEPVREKVSFDSEPLILVDENDNEVGYASKSNCHQGHGTLHRAFSIFLFDEHGRVLLQQRSAAKPLWPLYWSNSCCSHPRKGETMDQATRRRLIEELGIDASLQFLYKFIYQADFAGGGAEHELCHVYIGRSSEGSVLVHPDEIADWRWVEPAVVTRGLRTSPEHYTPWFRLEWQELMDRWQDRIQRLQLLDSSGVD
ncbi:MAG: isopentenyl-diphosphate Delta-isomerase [Wenzhouxiangellaceae bacterium]|nr:isopentenyl-diphosphate Delta-isomerase [Wenzhouxiangellaceae bacterium]